MKIKIFLAACLIIHIVQAKPSITLTKKAFSVNTNGTYTLKTTDNAIVTGQYADIKVGDIDGDGNLDVIYGGNSKAETGKGIALNDGSGIFTRTPLDVRPATSSCGFADLDNNGLLDYYVMGNGTENQGAIFFQNTDGTFTKDQSSFSGLNLTNADITTVDFNNDGYIDLFISGFDNTLQQRYSGILLNNGAGKFTVMDQPGLIQKGFGSSVWGDVDGDGWLDLLLNGDGGANGETSSNIYRLYRNNHGVLEPKTVFNDYRQISIGDGARMVDWDNDGKLDIILTGWSASKARQATVLFNGTSSSGFTFTESPLSNTDFPGVSQSSIETADLNNDGKIDLLITGFNGTQTNQVGKYNRNICGYYLNQSVATNAKPSTPGYLKQVVSNTGDINTVTFSWNVALDDKTPQASLTYNLSLKNTLTGKWLYNPMAVMSGTTNGWRRVAGLGNVFTNRKWVLNGLPTGTYEWTVQAIDANFVGGSFAYPKTFTIAATDVSEINSEVSIGTTDRNLVVNNKSGNTLEITVYTPAGSMLNQIKTGNFVSVPLTRGMYIVKVSDGKKTMTRKVVI